LFEIVLKTPINEVLALLGDIVWDFRPLQASQLPLEGHVHVGFAFEAGSPGVLA